MGRHALWAGSQMLPNRTADNTLEGILLFRRTSTGWRNDPAQTSQSSTKSTEEPFHQVVIYPENRTGWGWRESRSAEKDAGGPAGQQVEQESAVKQVNHILGCISKSGAGAVLVSWVVLVRVYVKGRDCSPLFNTCESKLGSMMFTFGLSHTRQTAKLKWVQQRPKRWREATGNWVVQSYAGVVQTLIAAYNYLMGAYRKDRARFFPEMHGDRTEEAKETSCNMGNSD